MNRLEFPIEMPVSRYRMKKLPQSAGAKAQNSWQRMQRRKSAEEAELRREQVHLKFISQDKDWKARRWLLCNFRPEKYRMTSFSGELLGKDGLPLFPAAENQFAVVLDVHAQPASGEPVAEAFRIVKPDGSAELWQPNGEKPPSS